MSPPAQFKFLSRQAFAKLNEQQRQAYLQEVARYVAGLNADLDEYDRRKNEEQDHAH